MIVYLSIFEKLAEHGFSAYRLQQEKLISSSTQDRIRHGAPINLSTIDTICRLCDCQPADLIRFVPDQE